ARAAGSVRHPNVASVFQLGTSQEHYFYAMEFVEGETLRSLIKRSGGLDPRLALEIVGQVAAGLEAIHKQKLVHRDIKPSNIMVSSAADGAVSVRVIDLGLAKTLTESESQEISILGAFVGTPEFASPEQFTGADVDIRSDLYSLGITLWQMLTGEPPFRGSASTVMNQHLNSPLPLEKLRDASQPVVALIEVLLRKNPARRFQTPAELAKMLPTVVTAIEAGQLVKQTIRAFVSSSSDVQTERNLANRIVRAIAAEFDIPVAESGSDFQRLTEFDPVSENDPVEKPEDQDHQKFALCLHFWDYSGQGQVRRLPDLENFELVICLLGNEMGLPVHPDLRLPDGGVPASGTEYEIARAAEHARRNHGLPVLRVYHNKPKLTVLLGLRPEREVRAKESASETNFLAEWEEKRKGTTEFNRYKTLEEFEEQFRSHFRNFVAEQIKQDAGSTLPEKRSRRWKSRPFRGLKVFDFEHAQIFFGRVKAIGEVLEALDQQRKVWRPFVLVVGGSGSGKSSLVRAGVLPQLIQPGTIEGIGLWRRAVTRPGGGGSGGDCFDALANALLDSAALPDLENPESTNAVEELAAELRDHPEAVALRVRDALDNAAREWKIQRAVYLREKEKKSRSSGSTTVPGEIVPRRLAEPPELPKARLALVVDQLEELFTSGFSMDVQAKYVSAIAGLAQNHRVFILATLRSDFYSSYQGFPELTELTRPSGKVDLRPPTAYEVGNMIRLPAEAAGLQFELDQKNGQRLDEGLRDAAATTPESLPLLQHVLSLLYDKQAERGDGLLRWSDYRDLGELKGALAKYAETVFATLQPHEQLAFPLVMRHLITLGQGEEEAPNRRTTPYHEFIAGDGENAKSGAKGFVDLFIAKRLFIADADPHGEVNVSVAHEALLREWQRIREWLAENRDFLRMRDRLDSSLRLWLSRGKQKDDLLGPGLPLAEGEKLLRDFEASLSQTQTDYVQASIAEQKRKHRIRDRIRYGVMAGITGALIVAIIFGAVSYRQYRRAERAKVIADHAAKRATIARDQAEQLINFMTTDLRDKLKPMGRLDLLADVNKRVEAYYAAFPGIEESAETKGLHALALANKGDIRKGLGDLAGALKSYQDSLIILNGIVDDNPKSFNWQCETAAVLEDLGDVFQDQGNLAQALAEFHLALTTCENLVPGHEDTPQIQRTLAVAWEQTGEVLRFQGDLPHALENERKALTIWQNLVRRDPDDVEQEYELSATLLSIGQVLRRQGSLGEAIQNYQECLTIRQALVDRQPSNVVLQHELATGLETAGEGFDQQGDLTKALDYYRQGLSLRQTLTKIDPSNTGWKQELAQSYDDVADVLSTQGDMSAGLQSYRAALEVRKKLAEQDLSNAQWQRKLSIDYSEVGRLLILLGKTEEGLENFRNCLSIGETLVGRDPANMEWRRDLTVVLVRIGDAQAEKDPDDALDSYRKAAANTRKLIESDPSNAQWQNDLSIIYAGLGDVLSDKGRPAEALEEYRASVAIVEKLSGADPSVQVHQADLLTMWRKIGDILKSQGLVSEALESYQKALAISEKFTAQDSIDIEIAVQLALCYYSAAIVLPRTDDASTAKARSLLEKGREILLRAQQKGALPAEDQRYLNDIEVALRAF
ncbi:MAG: serine/threonine protein kinase, partial [Verrucomicrobia bacterium]|nr:serine/threonine protein kinase [Verrucomicrobiota bacterium]